MVGLDAEIDTARLLLLKQRLREATEELGRLLSSTGPVTAATAAPA
ncbi:hypothetical protein ACFQ51_37015 [Streptomyces kaempferi]